MSGTARHRSGLPGCRAPRRCPRHLRSRASPCGAAPSVANGIGVRHRPAPQRPSGLPLAGDARHLRSRASPCGAAPSVADGLVSGTARHRSGRPGCRSQAMPDTSGRAPRRVAQRLLRTSGRCRRCLASTRIAPGCSLSLYARRDPGRCLTPNSRRRPRGTAGSGSRRTTGPGNASITRTRRRRAIAAGPCAPRGPNARTSRAASPPRTTRRDGRRRARRSPARQHAVDVPAERILRIGDAAQPALHVVARKRRRRELGKVAQALEALARAVLRLEGQFVERRP